MFATQFIQTATMTDVIMASPFCPVSYTSRFSGVRGSLPVYTAKCTGSLPVTVHGRVSIISQQSTLGMYWAVWNLVFDFYKFVIARSGR